MKRGLLVQLSLQQDVTLHTCAQVCLIDWSADGKKGMPTEIVVNETVPLWPKVGAPRTNGTRSVSRTDRTRSVSRTDRTRSVSRTDRTLSVSRTDRTRSVSRTDRTRCGPCAARGVRGASPRWGG